MLFIFGVQELVGIAFDYADYQSHERMPSNHMLCVKTMKSIPHIPLEELFFTMSVK